MKTTTQEFSEWLAGLIDGDGCFQLSKKGYASLEITMDIRDRHCLYQIKQKFGGSVKLKSGVNFLRYRLHHKKGLLDCIDSINGLLRNPVRILQSSKICEKYGKTFVYPSELHFQSSWLAGFLDADGSVYLNLASHQVFISLTQKNKFLLDPLMNLYGGQIYMNTKSSTFKWVVFQKSEILGILEYFKKCPPRSAKKNRIFLIPHYFELKKLKAHLATPTSVLGKKWRNFLKKWESYAGDPH